MTEQIYVCIDNPIDLTPQSYGKGDYLAGCITVGRSYAVEQMIGNVMRFMDDNGHYRSYRLFAPYLILLNEYRNVKINELLT